MDDRSYRQLVENSLGLMCVHDLEGRLTYVSPAAARALGWTPEDGVGRNLRGYLAPAAERLFDGYLQRIRDNGSDSGLMALLTKDGSERTWEYRNVLVEAPGADPYVVGHAIDVSERVRAEQALREARAEVDESHARHQSLVEGSALGICIHQHGMIRFANRRLAEMHGHDDPAGLVGQPYATLVAPGERAARAAQAEALGSGQRVPDRQEAEHVTRDGRPLWVETWTSAVQWKQAPAVLVAVIDISGRRRLETEVARMTRVEAMGRLAGGVAHEFNNLMAVIVGHAELLVHGLPADDGRRRGLEVILRTGYRAAQLATQLLGYSRRLLLRPETLDLGELLASVEPRLRALLPATLSLQCRAAAGLWPVRGDRAQIEDALLNLTANARDAMPAGGQLVVEAANIVLDEAFALVRPGARPGPHVVLTVRDTGFGMSLDVQAHLFEPFFTTKAVGEGAGLGLAGIYGIVKQHGGYIQVESAPGEGTTVSIYLPRMAEVEPAPEGAAAPTAP